MLCFLLAGLPLFLQGLFVFFKGKKEIPSIFTLKDQGVENFTVFSLPKVVVLEGARCRSCFRACWLRGLAVDADVSGLVSQGEGEGEGP